MRKAFIAPPGKKLVVSDFSQLELRIMAHRSQDKAMLEIYKGGGDIHQNTQDALGLGKKDRTVAKAANFGLIYGLSAQGLKDNLWNQARLAKTLEECQQWRYDFFKAYPGIQIYHEKIERFMKKHGYTLTLAGRRRRVKEDMERDYGYAYRMALNCTIQGSAADIVLIAMRNYFNSVQKMRESDRRWDEVKMLLQVHDEIIVETPEEIAEDAAALLQKDMEGAVTLRVPLIAEPGIATAWADAK
jgi:DNA polymerase-1